MVFDPLQMWNHPTALPGFCFFFQSVLHVEVWVAYFPLLDILRGRKLKYQELHGVSSIVLWAFGNRLKKRNCLSHPSHIKTGSPKPGVKPSLVRSEQATLCTGYWISWIPLAAPRRQEHLALDRLGPKLVITQNNISPCVSPHTCTVLRALQRAWHPGDTVLHTLQVLPLTSWTDC